MQGNADGMYKLVETVDSLVLPQVELGHEVGRVHHALVERPMVHEGKLVALPA